MHVRRTGHVGLPFVTSRPGLDDAPRLRVRTVSVDDPGPLLTLLPDGLASRDVSAWVCRGEGLVGWGRVASVSTSGPTRFADAQAWWQRVADRAEVSDEVRLPGTGLVTFGSLAYAAASPDGAELVVPRVVVGHRRGHWWVTTATPVTDLADGTAGTSPSPQPAPPFSASSLPFAPGRPVPPGHVVYSDGALSGPAYAAAVSTAVERIAGRAVEKVVLARDLVVDTSEPIDPRWLLRRLAATYGQTWVFAVDGLVGATPEMLIRLEKGLVTSRVLAGTIRRTGDDEHDLALAASLARSSKDLEEHEYAVRSVAEALAPHCTSMLVPEAPFVLHLPNVMHLASDVAGRLVNGATALGLAAALHPSAAVCGTPRAAADELIAELEHMDRGRYAGPVGWMDAAGDGEWGIALRSGALDRTDPRRMRIFAGCGIVAGSDPGTELAESDAKLVPMRTALDSAEAWTPLAQAGPEPAETPGLPGAAGAGTGRLSGVRPLADALVEALSGARRTLGP